LYEGLDLSWQIDVFDFLTAGSSAVAAGAGAAAFADVAAGAGVVAGAAALASAGFGSAAKLEAHTMHKVIRANRKVVFFMSILKISRWKNLVNAL
jgi:hypothetical protein